MNPPPPILPAAGCVTASAKAVAIAASTALPPDLRTRNPASEPGCETETTTPLLKDSAPSEKVQVRKSATSVLMQRESFITTLIGNQSLNLW